MSQDSNNPNALAEEWARSLTAEDKAGPGKERRRQSSAARTQAPGFKDFTAEAGASAEKIKRDLDFILDIPLEVTVELGRSRLLINDLLQLGPGSVVELDNLVREPVEVHVNGRLVARGEIVVVDGKFGVRLTDIVSPAERVNRLS